MSGRLSRIGLVYQAIRGETTMTNPAQVFKIIPRHYDIFGGLDVAKKNMAVTFTDHDALMRSLRLPYSSAHLLHYVRKHFPDRRLAFVYDAGPTGFGRPHPPGPAGCLLRGLAPPKGRL